MQIEKVFEYFSRIESTPKRLEMQDIISEMYSTLTPEEGAIVSYLLMGRVVPEFIAVEFQMADKNLRAVVESILERSISEDLASIGDVGSVWNEKGASASTGMDLGEYYNKLWEISFFSGQGSTQNRQDSTADLLRKVSTLSGRYTLRILNGKLRLGASDRTILDALGKANEPDYSKQLRKLYQDTSDLGYTVYLFKKHGEDAFNMSGFKVGIPVSAKLVEREDSIERIFERIPEPLEEPKYDGLRIQVHVFLKENEKDLFADRVWSSNYIASQNIEKEAPTLFGNLNKEDSKFEVQLFSRNLGNMTEMFPEVVEAAKKLPMQFEKKFGKRINSIVLDGEVIGYNDVVKEYLPFQQTMTRKRKHNVGSAADVVPVKVFVFDLIMAGEEDIMSEPLYKRKELLSFLDENQDIQSTIVKTPIYYPESIKEADDLFMEYISEGLEGVIFKDRDSVYLPGTRNFDWLKFKKAMKKDLADTVDVVLLGYYYGEGRLAEFGIGALLAGVFDRDNNQFLTATKIGTGITHDQWKEIKKTCDVVKSDKALDHVKIPKSLLPDVYLKPQLVVEVEADEITKSPLHTSGYALRFPRFKRFREKTAEQATTVGELSSI